MKKNYKRIVAIIALIAIALLIIGLVVTAFTTTPGSNAFYGFLFGIIAIPIVAWLLIFCIGKMENKRTIAEIFPENENSHGESEDNI